METNSSGKVCTSSSSSVEIALRGIAGVFLVLAAALTHWHSPYWIYFVAFIGLNLLQSAFTNWCPMMTILRKVFKLQG